jgi:hypothetical protein
MDESKLTAAGLLDCGPSNAASTSGGTKGLVAGTRSWARLCAKKHTRRRQPMPSLHSCVRYLSGVRHGWWQLSPHEMVVADGSKVLSCRQSPICTAEMLADAFMRVTSWGGASTQRRCGRTGTSRRAGRRRPVCGTQYFPGLRV